MSDVRHVLGISGGKDSSALAIYLRQLYPELEIEYYFCDTGKELDETYEFIQNLEVFLGKSLLKLDAAKESHKDPFDHFLEIYGGFLPSSTARWCTKKLKLEPFEKFVGDDPVISYVGIRGDENRDAYISKKPNIQSIFPFRQNIWSEDVIDKVLANSKRDFLIDEIENNIQPEKADVLVELIQKPVDGIYTKPNKLKRLLDVDTKAFNKAVFAYLKTTDYPLAHVDNFPLLENEDNLVKEDIINLLKESGVGMPEYYRQIEYDVEGKKGNYARSRSGCFFCFYQRRIEWIWLMEQHPDLFEKAKEYEKDGFTWSQGETLEELSKPERVKQIKEEFLEKSKKLSSDSDYLIDNIDGVHEGCTACFL